jgi:hypothetical protein
MRSTKGSVGRDIEIRPPALNLASAMASPHNDLPSSFILKAFTQSYDWGKLGSTSKAAQYAKAADPSFALDENKPYAEVSGLLQRCKAHLICISFIYV